MTNTKKELNFHNSQDNDLVLKKCCKKKKKLNWFNEIVNSFYVFGTFFTIAIFYLISNLIVTAPGINAGEFEKFILNNWIWFTITTLVVILYSGKYVVAYIALFKKKIDMHVLLGFAAHSLYIYSSIILFINYDNPYFTTDIFWHGIMMLILLTQFGHILEKLLENKALKEFKELTAKKSVFATIKRGIKLVKINLEQVKVGDILVVRKGEHISFDGDLISDIGVFNTASITGESVPKNLKINEKVISGYVSESDYLEIKITKDHANSTFSKIVEKMKEISQQKPKIQRISNQISKIFVPTLLGIGLAVFIGWSLATAYGNPTINGSAGKAWYQNALKATMTTIAIACPCAFGIIVPLSLSITVGTIYKNQIFTNSPILLEKDLKITDVCLDKTGTLTTGNMKMIHFSGNDKYLSVIKSIEFNSSHPIAKSIVDSLESTKLVKITNFKEKPGKGVSAIYNQKHYELKAYKNAVKTEFKSPISTKISLSEDGKIVGILEIEDELKSDSDATIKMLKKENFKVHLITGDNPEAANYISKKLNIDVVISQVSPIEKYEYIKKLRAKGKKVLYVGDGINDVVAMKEADISASFSSENSMINNHADTVLVSKKTSNILNIITIAKKSARNIKWLFIWAITYNVVLIPVAATMTFDPWVSAITMSGSDILLILLALIYKLRLNKSMLK